MQLSELVHGATFLLLSNQKKYMVTHDFDSRNNRLCVNITNGSMEWIPDTSEVSLVPIYVLDETNNIIPLNEDGSYGLEQN